MSKKAQALISDVHGSKERAAKNEAKLLRAEVKRLQEALDLEKVRSGVTENLRETARKPVKIKHAARENLHKRLATPVLLCSDHHVGERVIANRVNGVNAYDAQEAAKRARRLADGMVWLIEHHRTSFEIREAVIWLGGDLITGFLHADQMQSNTLPPSKEVLLVQDLMGELIDKVLAIPGMEKVIVPTSHGNHGRTTHKVQVATGADNSFEWLLYHQMRRTYSKDSRVEWHIADGEFNRLKVHNTNLGFTHGDICKFGGGVGGLTVPVLRAMPRWQTYGHCDLYNIGHFHTYMALPSLVVNGSLIGAAPYGMRVGALEEPAQAFYLVDSTRGPCMHTPVWVSRRKGET